MNVSEIMTKRVITARTDTSFRELWRLIVKKHINAIPVVDKAHHLIGLVTKEDLLKSLYPDYQEYLEDLELGADFEVLEEKIHERIGLKVRDIMCTRVIFTYADTPIMRALSRMIVRRVDQLPIVSSEDRVVGMVTRGDIFKVLFRKHLAKGGRRTRS